MLKKYQSRFPIAVQTDSEDENELKVGLNQTDAEAAAEEKRLASYEKYSVLYR